MKKPVITIITLFTLITSVYSQSLSSNQPLSLKSQIKKNTENLKELEFKLDKFGSIKFSGYIQGQFQWAESDGSNAFASGGNFASHSNNRFMIRRGRIKLTYTKGIVSAVFQPNFTEKGVGIKDVYFKLSSNNKVISGQFGIFDRPFGYEISYSSSVRESPERSRVFLSLFPGEREVGAMLTLQGAKGKGWLEQFALNAGLFNGNGIGKETDSRKDFIGRLAWLKKTNAGLVGVAASTYIGGIRNPTSENYQFKKDVGFEKSSITEGSFSPRRYYGLAVRFLQDWSIGETNLRAEWLYGNNPGTSTSNNNPSGNSFGNGDKPLYLRIFTGGYAILSQTIGQSKHGIVVKYDYYDPNTSVKGEEIGSLKSTGVADISYSTWGLGYLYNLNKSFRFMVYYDFVKNETTQNLDGYSSRLKQNILTLRAQVKF